MPPLSAVALTADSKVAQSTEFCGVGNQWHAQKSHNNIKNVTVNSHTHTHKKKSPTAWHQLNHSDMQDSKPVACIIAVFITSDCLSLPTNHAGWVQIIKALSTAVQSPTTPNHQRWSLSNISNNNDHSYACQFRSGPGAYIYIMHNKQNNTGGHWR